MSKKSRDLLSNGIESTLRQNPDRMFSKEEILNLLSHLESDAELEEILAELEIAASGKGSSPPINAKCKGGTVFYQWHQADRS